jgi:hypothetical protein
MVDALRRARALVVSYGDVVDVHPTADPATVDVNGEIVGVVEPGGAPQRHAAADAALAAIVADGAFGVAATVEFEFHTVADRIEELRDQVAATWREGRIAGDTVDRARHAAQRTTGRVSFRVIERVRVTRLTPLRSLP